MAINKFNNLLNEQGYIYKCIIPTITVYLAMMIFSANTLELLSLTLFCFMFTTWLYLRDMEKEGKNE